MTSGDCFCTPAEAFDNEDAIDWINPLVSNEYVLESHNPVGDTIVQRTLIRKYEEGIACIGGDECCAGFTAHKVDFYFKDDSTMATLLHVEAVGDDVSFYSTYKIYPIFEYFVAHLDAKNLDFNPATTMSLTQSDTLIDGESKSKVVFTKLDKTNKKILFNKLTFIKEIGVVSYLDTANVLWKKK